MKTTGLVLRRILLARPEVQGALIATLNALSIFGAMEALTEDQLAATNILLVAWFGLASKLAFQRDLQDMTTSE